MRTTTTTTTTLRTLATTTTEALADFGAGVLLPLGGLAALGALFVGPLFLLARSLGVC